MKKNFIIKLAIFLFLFIGFLGALFFVLKPAGTFLFKEDKTILVLLQNSHELRATGGFLGSYGIVKMDRLNLKEVHIEDIYQPAGQLKEYIKPPTGVSKYLSSENGWGLADANWQSDFPSTAGQFMQMLQLAGYDYQPDMIVAVNLNIVEKLLDQLGGLQMIDYNIWVNGENFARYARADRENFFPGSRQKQNFLQSFASSLLIKLRSLSLREKRGLVNWAKNALVNKDVQIWSKEAKLQKYIEDFNFAGKIHLPDTGQVQKGVFFIQSIESNVGINKANVKIGRYTQIEYLDQNDINITTWIQNNNPDKANLYSNYQRFLINQDVELKAVYWNDELVTEIDEEILQTTAGMAYKQIGFLLQLEENQIGKLEVIFHNPREITEIVWEKQSGAEHPYIILKK